MEENLKRKYFGQDLGWLKSDNGREMVKELLDKYEMPNGSGIYSVLYHGHSGGSFVDAICRMDFHDAYHRADLCNRAHFMNYIKFAHELSIA